MLLVFVLIIISFNNDLNIKNRNLDIRYRFLIFNIFWISCSSSVLLYTWLLRITTLQKA